FSMQNNCSICKPHTMNSPSSLSQPSQFQLNPQEAASTPALPREGAHQPGYTIHISPLTLSSPAQPGARKDAFLSICVCVCVFVCVCVYILCKIKLHPAEEITCS